MFVRDGALGENTSQAVGGGRFVVKTEGRKEVEKDGWMDAAAAAVAPTLPPRYFGRLCVSTDDVNLPIPCNRSAALSSPAAARTRTHVCRLRDKKT